VEAVAPELVGAVLVRDAGTPDEVRATLVEVEAYRGLDDPASHAFRGPTPRAAIMFGDPGVLYVYLSYGLHHCANIVCEPAGEAGAVLLRAAAVVAGEGTALARRLAAPRRGEAAGWRARAEMGAPPATPVRRAIPRAALLRGPGNLCRGLGLSLAENGLDLCARGASLRVLPPLTPPPLDVGPRVGVSAAAGEPLRFAWRSHPAVSPGPRGPG
jgi:DNA-3-methyladenine glycosylase